MQRRLSSLLAVLVISAIPAAADTLAINFSNTTGQPLSNPPMTLGWRFEVKNPIRVTWLSFFDSEQDGLAESHPIGLWTSAGSLLVSATVDPGSVNPLHDKFRAVPVTPTLLAPGAYQIGALFTTAADSNMFPTFTADFSTAADITYIRSASAVGASLTFPPTSFFFIGPAYFGPNFEYQAVPEPGSFTLTGTAALVCGLMFRKRLRGRLRGRQSH